MKKKILFVITKSNWGGAQRYVYDLATSIPKEQFEAVVALGGEGVLADKLRDTGVRTIPLPFLTRNVSLFKDLASFFALWKLFRAERPDVVHLNSAKASGLGALAARCARVPNIIFTAHGWAFNENRPPFQRLLIKFFSWLTVVLAHKTIAVSDAVHDDTKRWSFVRNKIHTIKNGIVAPQFVAREEARATLTKIADAQGQTLGSGALRSDLGHRDIFLLGTIAELHKNKGLEYAILALAQIAPSNPHAFYFILGDGEEKEQLHALIKQHGLEERVFLLGFVPDAAQYLPAFDCFILPSIKEGLPYVLLEAGYASLPVIATNVGGIPEIIDDAAGLLVPPRDTDALARSIEQLVKNPTDRAALGTALHDKVAKEFSLSKMADETVALYSKK